MCFRGICITARSLVRYGSAGCIWGWGDWPVWCRLGIDWEWWNGRAGRWCKQVWINGGRGFQWANGKRMVTSNDIQLHSHVRSILVLNDGERPAANECLPVWPLTSLVNCTLLECWLFWLEGLEPPSMLRYGRRTQRCVTITVIFIVWVEFGCRSSSGTSRAPTRHSSTSNDSVQNVLRASRTNSNRTITSDVSHSLLTYSYSMPFLLANRQPLATQWCEPFTLRGGFTSFPRASCQIAFWELPVAILDMKR